MLAPFEHTPHATVIASADLTATANGVFALVMRRLARQRLAGALVVVTALGGLAGALQVADHHAHRRAPAESVAVADAEHHGDAGHHHDDAGMTGAHAGHDDGTERDRQAPASSGCCPSDHGYCCTVTALPATASPPKPTLGRGARQPDAGPPVPLGQLTYPLLRPPRHRV